MATDAPACSVCGSIMVYRHDCAGVRTPENLVCAAESREPDLHDQLAEARATIRRLNRRCQLADAAAAEKLRAHRPGSLGRALLTWGVTVYRSALEAIADDPQRARAIAAAALRGDGFRPWEDKS